MVLNGDLKLLTFCNINKQCIPCSDAASASSDLAVHVCQYTSPGFLTALFTRRQSDKNSTAILINAI